MRSKRALWFLAIPVLSGCVSPPSICYQNQTLASSDDGRSVARAAHDLEHRVGKVVHDEPASERMALVAQSLLAHQPLEHAAKSCSVARADSCAVTVQSPRDVQRSSAPAWPSTQEYHLLDSDELGAYSLTDGRIYVTRGLYRLLAADELLAAVLAHELAHIMAGDGEMPAALTSTIRLRREMIADRRAADLLSNAGWPPNALIRVLHITRDAHPKRLWHARIVALDRYLATASASTQSN